MFTLIGFLVNALVMAVVIYVIYLILGMVNLPSPIKNIVYLILGVILILWVLSATGVYVMPLN
jgi:hypothetical protein